MIKFELLKWKNFLSYGNGFSEYNFKPGIITRITGKNGKGKSTVLEALHFCLFGRPYRKVKIQSLVNNINKKNLEVELFFQKGKSVYLIKRGLLPHYFIIEKDGKMIDQPSTTAEYQKILESILGFDESIFQQVSVKTLTKLNSFVGLPRAEKRAIIENIFELEQISELKELNKVDLNEYQSTLSLLEADESKFKILIQQEEDNILQLKKIKEELDQKQKLETNEKEKEIQKLQSDCRNMKKGLRMIVALEVDLEKVNKTISSITLDKNKCEIKKDDLLKDIEAFQSRLDFMKSKCGGCPKVNELSSDPEIEGKKKQVQALVVMINDFNNQIKEEEKELGRLERLISKKHDITFKLNSAISSIRKIQDDIKKAKSQIDIDIDETKYKEYKLCLRDAVADQESMLDKIKHAKAIAALLKDDGIKSYIVQKYLPLINKLLNDYLHRFSINIELEVTPEFEIKVLTKFKEHFTYYNFSDGEKKRIDTALLFTFLDFCKMKYSGSKTNVLVIDEFSSGLDPDGENVLYEIMKDLSVNGGMEVLTISHNINIDPDKIDRIYEAEVIKGFSTLTEKIED